MTACQSLICAQLLFLESENPSKEISMYINSPGGVVTIGSVDLRHDAVHQAEGFDAGDRAGGLDGVAAADRRAKRACASAAQQPRHGSPALGRLSGPGDRHHDPRARDAEAEGRLNEIYVNHTGNAYETVEAALERDNFMSAEDAKAWGLIDEILESRGKADDTSK